MFRPNCCQKWVKLEITTKHEVVSNDTLIFCLLWNLIDRVSFLFKGKQASISNNKEISSYFMLDFIIKLFTYSQFLTTITSIHCFPDLHIMLIFQGEKSPYEEKFCNGEKSVNHSPYTLKFCFNPWKWPVRTKKKGFKKKLKSGLLVIWSHFTFVIFCTCFHNSSCKIFSLVVSSLNRYCLSAIYPNPQYSISYYKFDFLDGHTQLIVNYLRRSWAFLRGKKIRMKNKNHFSEIINME